MSWFDTTGFATLAKTALNSAQKTIDRALDIRDDGQPKAVTQLETVKGDESFFSSFGLGEAKNIEKSSPDDSGTKSTVTETPSKSSDRSQMSQSGLWGDWGASFYNIGLQKIASGRENDPQRASPGLEMAPETSQPSASSSLPPSVESDDSTVFQQPQRKQLFPEEEKGDQECNIQAEQSDTEENTHQRKGPLKLQSKVTKVETCEPAVETTLSEETTAEVTDLLSVSTILATLAPVVANPVIVDVLVADEKECFEKKLSSSKNPQLEVSNETSTSSNESADTLCEDDDEEETEEELTVMEKKPQGTKDLHLELSSPCVPDPPSTDYCVIENGTTQEMTNIHESYSEPSISCSTSMEIILEAEVMNQDSEALADSQLTSNQDLQLDICSQVSSPDSVVPICEEPSSNLPSPHFPDIHIIPSSSSYIAVQLDLVSDQNLCDSDITILSPSVAESTDSESCDNNKPESEPVESKEVRDCETSSSGSKASNTSSSGSFVNCSLEDADPCYMQQEHSVSSNNNSERSSDPTGKETETSGHTSGDDIETTTSSDIEIISPPSCDNGDRSSISPLKHILVPRLHRMRAQSENLPASDASKDNFTMPVVLESDEQKGLIYDHASKSRRSLTSEDYPEPEGLVKRIIALQEVLNARERKVLELSKENADILEVNARMKCRVEKLEETQSQDSEDVSKLTREFSQRLSQLESRLHETQEERDCFQMEIERLRIESSRSVSADEMAILVNEKNQQISELMQEGEKLSKQQLQLSTIIKKLRTKEKETEATLKNQREKIEEQTKELERLRKSLGAKDEQEKKHIDAIRQLSTTVHKQEEEKETFKNELEDANDKVTSMKNNMDRAYKEMTDVQKKLAEKESEIQEATISAELTAKESLSHQLSQVQEQSDQERETLMGQAAQLRSTLARAEQQGHLREESLRADIAVLQQRLQEADIRNDDLTQTISSATRPLQRQIENLQIMHSTQVLSWEKLEKTLTISLNGSQTQTALAKEEARQALEQLSSLSAQLAVAESRSKAIGHEKVQLAALAEMTRTKLALLEEARQRDATALEVLKTNFADEITSLKTEKENLIKELVSLKEELEKRKVEQFEDKLENTPGLSCASGRSSPTLSMTLSHHSSVSDNQRFWAQEQGSEASLEPGGRPSMYDVWWGGSASTMMENLQSQVKLRKGEVHQLQSEINRLDRVRESVADELGSMARKNEDLVAQIEDLLADRQSFQEMEQKYNTLLQMYGEKVEESEELKLDLADVKAMYRAQIDELLRKS